MGKNLLYKNIALPLMPAPVSTVRQIPQTQTYQYCGGKVSGLELPPPSYVNGKRIPKSHETCLVSASEPLFDMGEQHFRARPWHEK